MKLSFTERLLLAFTGILGVLIAAALGAVTYYGDRLTLTIAGFAVTLKSGVWPAVVLGVVALIALIWALKLLALAFKTEPRQDRSSVSVQHTDNGSVRVSVAAMDTLVKQAIGRDEGVVDIKTAIINHEDSISVNIDMTLASDVHIPNVTMMMQRTIKNFIEEFSGIAVRDVSIMVSKIVEVRAQPPLALPEKPAPGAARDARSETEISAPEQPAQPQTSGEAAAQEEPAELEGEAVKDPVDLAAEPAEAEPADEAEPAVAAEPADEAESVAEAVPMRADATTKVDAENEQASSDKNGELVTERDVW
jgi:uncharacterized alkaline shock family protein YloU